MIRFQRDATLRDIFRSYSIEIDGERVGKVGRNEELTVEVEPGKHNVRAVIDWASSPMCEVVTHSDSTVIVKVAPSGGVWASLLRPKRYIALTVEAQ
jgi:hypothetical protein